MAPIAAREDMSAELVRDEVARAAARHPGRNHHPESEPMITAQGVRGESQRQHRQPQPDRRGRQRCGLHPLGPTPSWDLSTGKNIHQALEKVKGDPTERPGRHLITVIESSVKA